MPRPQRCCPPMYLQTLCHRSVPTREEKKALLMFLFSTVLSPMLLNSAKFHEITDSVIFLSSSKLVEWPIVTPVKNCVEVIQLSCPSPIIIKSCGRLMIVPISSRVSSHARSVSSFPPAMLPGVPVSKTCHRLSTQRLLRHASSSREAWRSLRR